MLKSFIAIIAVIFSQVSLAENAADNALKANLERLEHLQFEDFRDLGQLIINNPTDTVTGLKDGELVAGYNRYIRSNLDEGSEVLLAVLDADLSGDFSVGDGLLLKGMTDRLVFQYMEGWFDVAPANFSESEVKDALLKIVADADLATDIGALNSSFDRIDQQLENASPTIRSVQDILFR